MLFTRFGAKLRLCLCSVGLYAFASCIPREKSESDAQLAASSAFDWGQFIMSVIPVNISESTQKESDPHICLFEVNWSREWPGNPKMWSSVYAKHINAKSIDNAYIREYTLQSPTERLFVQSLVGQVNVACGAVGLNKNCRLPFIQESSLMKSVKNHWIALLEKRKNRRTDELNNATELKDVTISRSSDYVLYLDRIKKLKPNLKSGKNCLEHPFDLRSEHQRLQEIGDLFVPQSLLK